ncbi:hypothetical protein NIE88_04030 [Sporolactobacillus shoreicorticis]|uniref:Uncharacterized protein n=1 Tax=Sporolactobacillus shoreicorticis TaxID=1923877 RepID=A0ABW5RZ64_9BACL|nr:hypothetical protein [Sporolactobacillus shoreicorticis]MCO7124944.1 hypothetical protein [Sporolactobacillus shoreicorticis]
MKLKKPITAFLLLSLVSMVSVNVVEAEKNNNEPYKLKMTQEQGKQFNLSPEEVKKFNKDGYVIRLSKKAKENGVTAEVQYITHPENQ